MRGAACILTLNHAAAALSRALSRPAHLRALRAGQWPAWQPPGSGVNSPGARPGSRAWGLRLRPAAAGWLRWRWRSGCSPASSGWIARSRSGGGGREARRGRPRGDAPPGAARREGAERGAGWGRAGCRAGRARRESRGAQGGVTELGGARAGRWGESGRTRRPKAGGQCSQQPLLRGSSFELPSNWEQLSVCPSPASPCRAPRGFLLKGL